MDMFQVGWEVNMPDDVILNFPQAEQLPQTQATYLQKMLSRLQEVQYQDWQHLWQAQLMEKKYYGLKARAHPLSEGDLAYKKSMGCRVDLSWKLCPLFVGPYIMKAMLPYDLFLVEGQWHLQWQSVRTMGCT